MLERFSPQLQHWLLMVGAALLSTVLDAFQSNLTSLLPILLKGMSPVEFGLISPIVVSLVGSAVLWATKLTTKYGVGSGSPNNTGTSGMATGDIPANDVPVDPTVGQ